SAAIYQLARRGLRVLGLEAFEAGHRLGSSHGESRIIRMAYYEHPNYVPLLRRAYALWEELERESGAELMRLVGGLMIGRPDGELVSGARASAEQYGQEYQLLDRAEVQRRYPVLHLMEDEVALWEPRAGYLRPERCIETFVGLAQRSGAETHYSERVRSWRADPGGVEVVTDTAAYAADSVVFACGARISQLMGASMPPVRPERATLFWMEPAEHPELFTPERF